MKNDEGKDARGFFPRGSPRPSFSCLCGVFLCHLVVRNDPPLPGRWNFGGLRAALPEQGTWSWQEKKKKKRLNEGGRASYVLVLLILPRICSHRLALRCKKKKKKKLDLGKANQSLLFWKLPQGRSEMARGFSDSSWCCQAP